MTVYVPRWDRVAHMNAGKDRAAERRSRGLATGSLPTRRKLAPAPTKGTWERREAESRARYEYRMTDAIEQFRFDVHGQEWEQLR